MNYFVFKEDVELYELKYLWIDGKRIKACPTRVKLAVIKSQSSVHCGGGLGGDMVKGLPLKGVPLC